MNGREKKREWEKKHYFAHPEAFALMRHQQKLAAREKYWKDPQAGRERSRQSWPRYRDNAAQARAALRDEVINAYGGHCVCCGEQEKAFLTIDHVTMTSREHRTVARSSVYVDLKRRGWPKEDFRLLCMNCNWVIRGGKACPHQTDVMAIGACVA